WQWQQELEQVKEDLDRLRQQEEEVERQRQALLAAGRAAMVVPLGEEFRQAGTAAREAEQALGLLQERLPGIRRTLEEAQQAARRAAEERRQCEPLLLEKRGRLEQAGRLEKELADLQQQGREKVGQLQELEREQKELALQREEKSRRQEELEQQLAACRRELGQVTLPFALRQHLDEAWLLWQSCRDAEERWSRAGEQSRSWQEKLGLAQTELAAAQRNLQEAEKAVRELEQAVDRARQAELAAALAAGLVAGQPCPVCGSPHHPRPAGAAAGSELARLNEQLAAAQQALENARRREKQAAAARAALQGRWAEAAAAEREAAVALEGQRQYMQKVLQALAGAAAAAGPGPAGGEDAFNLLCRQALQQPALLEELRQQTVEREKRREELEERRAGLEKDRSALALELSACEERLRELAVALTAGQAALSEMRRHYRAKQEQLRELTGGQPVQELLEAVQQELDGLAHREEETRRAADAAAGELARLEKQQAVKQKETELAAQRLQRARQALDMALAASGFAALEQAEAAWLDEGQQEQYRKAVEEHQRQQERLLGQQHSLQERLAGRRLAAAEWQRFGEELEKLRRDYRAALQDKAVALEALENKKRAHARWCELVAALAELEKQRGRLEELKSLLRGNAFVQFVAQEQLVNIARAASVRLGQLTRYRYALEVTGEGGFIISDEANGGIKRPVSSLSGGETFLASLALALALSAQIQLKGRHPLEFFFLDEGFGTLDAGLLDTVVSTLEKLRLENLHIGLISHVPELQKRLPRRLLVHPPGPDGRGSRVELEVG
ncbi:MAG: SbcC/MukB-like Walker B domain-containing protein, partial [Bacillota bacterium]